MLFVLASGSSGNSYCVKTGSEFIFIDMGLPKCKVKKFLTEQNYNGEKISIFITHEHNDHISGLGVFLNEYRANVYASHGTSKLLVEKLKIDENLIYPISSNNEYEFESFCVTPLDISHDAAEPYGYIISTDEGNIGFMTDLGLITKDQIDMLKNTDTLILESNHDKHMLANGKYPYALKRRVGSIKGHLSNDDAVMAVSLLAGSCLKQCLLAHVSEENNSYELLNQLADFIYRSFGIYAHVLKQNERYDYDICPLSAAGAKA